MSKKDLHAFAQRGPYRALTEFVNRRILAQIALQPDDYVVDIGCGDGFFLKLALETGVRTAIGITPNEYEAACLRSLGLDVRIGSTDSVPLPDATVSVVVCHSVFLLVPESRIAKSLSEIARACSPGARVWIGEVPFVREPEAYPRHQNIPEMLWWLLRNHGLRSFLGVCRRLVTGVQRGPVLRHPTQAVYFTSPEDFIRLAAETGLHIVHHEPHQTLSADQQPCRSPTRHDYLFKRENRGPGLYRSYP